MRHLANDLHWKVLMRLAAGPKTVDELAAGLPVTASTVSMSVARLKDYGLVDFDVRKNWHVYRLESGTVEHTAANAIRVQIVTADGGALTLERSLPPVRREVPQKPRG